MSITYADALARHDITIPAHLIAQAEVPVLATIQAQGDVLIRPHTPGKEMDQATPVPSGGVQVVRGEATANTHWLDNADPDAGPCMWLALPPDAGDGLGLGLLTVPEGQSALLTHTDEHGSNGIAPGRYRISRQREQAEQIRRVQD